MSTVELTNDHPALARCWHPIARSGEIGRQPHRAVLLGVPWVLWRADDGQVVGFEDRCPHRRAPLSLGSCEGESLVCGYHGWRFAPDGTCLEIPSLGEGATLPSRAALSAPAGITEAHGLVFLCPEDPIVDVPQVPEAEDPSFMLGELPVVSTRGSAALLADNFLDMAHFPFVHTGTFGDAEEKVVHPYEVERDGFSSIVRFEHAFTNREDPGVEAGLRPLIQQRRLTYRYTAPFHLALRIDFLDAGGTNTVGLFLCPESSETTRIYSSLWRDDLEGDPVRMKEAVDFEVAVLEEDLRIQSRYDILSVPLDVTEEVHVKADKTTVELRRILSALVELAAR